MANRSLGTLTIDLIARTAGFVEGMDAATRASNDWSQKVARNAAAAAANTSKMQRDFTADMAKLEAALDPTTAALKTLAVTQAGVNELFKASDIDTAQYVRYSASINKMRQDLTGETAAAERAAAAQQNTAAAFNRLKASLDPASAAADRLRENLALLNTAKASGLVDSATYAKLNTQLQELNATAVKGKLSAGQMEQGWSIALYQVKDGFESLVSGGSPIRTLAQQLPMLLLSFGSVGATLSAFAAAINPVVVGVVALVGVVAYFGYQAYAASQRNTEFNQVLAATGNISGQTAKSLTAAADALSKTRDVSMSAAAEAVKLATGIADSADQITLFSDAAVLISKNTGQSVSDVIKEFDKLNDDPVKALQNLNDQYNFANKALYDHVKALSDSGDKASAVTLIIDALSASQKQFGDNSASTMSTVSGWWDTLIGKASQYKTWLDTVGSNATNFKAPNAAPPTGLAWLDNSYAAQAKTDKAAQDAAAQDTAYAQKQMGIIQQVTSQYKIFNKEQISAAAEIDALTERGRTNAQKRADEEKKYSIQLKKGVIDQKQYNSAMAAVDNLYKDPKTPKPKQDKLATAYQNRLDALQRQAALVNTTGLKDQDPTELDKVNYDIATGKLEKLNEAQKENLRNAAKQVDAANALKAAAEDQAKAQAFAEGLSRENANIKQGNDVQFVGAGMGSQARSRMQDMVKIQQDYANKQADLQKQYNTGKIHKSLYDTETKDLQSALDDRIKIQQDYWDKLDKQKSDWQSGALDSLQDYMTTAQDYNQQAADAVSSVLQTATSSIAENITAVITGTESIGDALRNVGQAILTSIVDALAKMAAQWIVNQALMMALGQSSTAASAAMAAESAIAWAPAATAASIATFGGAAIAGTAANVSAMATGYGLFGMAHDGVDSVPQTGTWLLQKGERVTTAKTSAKLDATLDRVSSSSSGGGGTYAPTIPISINGNPSDATIELTRKAAREGAIQGYKMVNKDLQTGTGTTHANLTSRYNTKRSAR